MALQDWHTTTCHPHRMFHLLQLQKSYFEPTGTLGIRRSPAKKAKKSGLQGLIWLCHYWKDGDHLVNLGVPSLETQSFHDGTVGQAASIGFRMGSGEIKRGVALFPLQFQFLVHRWIENSPYIYIHICIGILLGIVSCWPRKSQQTWGIVGRSSNGCITVSPVAPLARTEK